MIMDEREAQTSKKPVVNQRREREKERESEREREIVVLNERIVISLSHYIFQMSYFFTISKMFHWIII